MFKNTLARRAMAGAELGDVVSLLEGPVAIAFVRGDAAAAAKALRDFGRTNAALVLKGGLLGDRVLVPAELAALAELPSRDALLAQIAGAFQAPLVKAAGLFQAMPRNLAYGVKALIDQRVAGGEAAPADDAPAAASTEAEPAVAEPAEAEPAEAEPAEAEPTEADAHRGRRPPRPSPPRPSRTESESTESEPTESEPTESE